MILYCPDCNSIVGKTEETMPQGTKIEKKCQKCGKVCNFFVRYKAISNKSRR